MQHINVTEFRSHLPAYLKTVQNGEEVKITSRGKVIARLVPEKSERDKAKAFLKEARKTAKIGDIISPIDEEWEANN